jgi:nucleoside-diphosphate-sugar epimerase
VQLSSVAVYGKPESCPMTEHGPLRPRSAYERTKLEGERAVLGQHGRGIEVAVLRPTLVYGPRSRYGQAMMIALAAQARALGLHKLPLIAGGPLGHHVHAADVARAAELLALHPDAAGRSFNVADDEPLGVGDSLVAIAQCFGLRCSERSAPLAWRAAAPVAGWVPQRLLDALNERLLRGKKALDRRGRGGALTPRLDRDWLGYCQGDFVFDTRRLHELGFRAEHPNFRDAVPQVVDWYHRRGWLPKNTDPNEEGGDERAARERAA